MRFKYLDVLKAFAIIFVVLYHSGFLTYGYLGVDIFLVVNGYLITRSLAKKIAFDNGITALSCYLDFEISRVVRLLPVLLVADLVCMTLGYWVMLPDDYENLSESVVATNLFGNNILAAITTKNYWDVVNEYKPLMHTWYVGLVMQFYLFYPFLFFLARLDKKNPQHTLSVIISALAIVSLIIYFGTADVAKRFYFLPSRFFEFAAGGLVALIRKPQEGNTTFKRWFVYVCYVLLVVLIVVNREVIPSEFRLVTIVALSVVLVRASSTLENRVTANGIFAKIGAASYSIFVWHQVLLAFYRYTISSHFTVLSYALLLVAVSILSWGTYRYIERKTSAWLNDRMRKMSFYAVTFALCLALTAFAVFIYMKRGVVRDVPELYISRNEHVSHKAYNDLIYELDKPFETERLHWLVVGNSFGRDFANVILESPVADSIEVSYIYISNYKDPIYSDRFASADRVFLSSLGADEKTVDDLELVCKSSGFNTDNLVIVGTKNFGASNGQFYFKRNKTDYFDQRTEMEPGYFENNEKMKDIYGERYLDLIGLVVDENGTMPVFTPDHHFVSQDCRHLSQGGAIWFGQLINWNKYTNKQ